VRIGFLTGCVVDGVATLAFDRPEALNAIDARSFATLGEVLAALTVDDEVRVIVLRGAGPNFSAGADIKEPIPPPETLLAEPVESHPTALLYRMPKPTVAAIRGYCLGGGLELALAADIRLAAEDATFGFAEIDWCLTTGWGGGVLLERLVGRSAALELLLTGRRFGAAEALRLGLVSEVVPVDAFDQRLKALGARLADAPPEAVQAFKELLSEPTFEAGLRREIETFAAISQSREARRRLAAFGRGAAKASPAGQ
jgi:enoyl-CoA hydratase/carnithine racemase